MKQKLILFILIVTALFLHGCGKIVQSDNEGATIKREEKYGLEDDEFVLEAIVSYKYIDGILTKSYYGMESNKIYKEITYTPKSSISGEKSEFDTEVYTCDGYVDKYIEIDKDKESSTTYNGSGDIISTTMVKKESDGTEKWLYTDEDGNELYYEIHSYDQYGNLSSVSKYQEDILVYTEKYTYDDENRLVKSDYYNRKGKLIEYTDYIYD